MTRTRHRLLAAAMVIGALSGTPGLAGAQPAPAGPDTMAVLIGQLADANQRLQEFGAAVQSRQESVNKAIVDVQTAREAAAAAEADVATSQRAVADANAAIAAAQQRFDVFATAAYVNGPSMSYLNATSPDDVIAAASADQTLAMSAQQTLTDLQRARTEQVNRESRARAAQQAATEAAAQAQCSQDAAVAALTEAQRQFGDQRGAVDRLVADRDAAQNRVNAARATWSTTSATAAAPTVPGANDRWGNPAVPAPVGATQPAAGPPANTGWDTSLWDPTLPAIPSAFVSGDPIAIINTLLGMSATSSQVTSQLGRNFLTQLGILQPTDTGITNGRIPRVYGRQASEYVIRRAMSQIGVPYSWGGGTAAGPGRGIDSGAGTIGFDCSGLMLFAFAGVGIKLPHYSGAQYDAGRKIPAAQMRRGDMIFYGPNASQHVALYLGNGQMLEAQQTGVPVKVSPVRTGGMTPYVTRLIEY